MAGLRYTALKQNEIRVLRSTSTKDLVFDLVHISLESKPCYCALSYTWGTPKFTHRVIVGNQQIRVTENLHDALRQLTNRQQDKSPSIVPGNLLWVDAVCIDQSNTIERGQQICLMKMLYEQAHKVYVWLGKPEKEIYNELAAQKMAEFTKRHRRFTANDKPYRPWWWPNKPARYETNIYGALADISPHDRTVFDVEGSATYNAWLGICAIWRKSWWTRTWVFQEATVPDQYTLY